MLARCWCSCHLASVLPWAPPPVSDPVEALCACRRCREKHAGVWSVWPMRRIVSNWIDEDDA
jgi:hypothetical protein